MLAINKGNNAKSGLLSILGINSGDKTAIIGCGGKTSLMYALAEESRKNSVLITTTTRILPPPVYTYDFVMDGEAKDIKNGIYLLYGGEKDGKLFAPPIEKLLRVQSFFDYVFIEADGSKIRPLKGWADYEPVIPCFVTTTTAVATLSPIGEPLSEENAHRLPIFCELTGALPGEAVTPAHIAAMISNPRGMLQKAAGKKVLFINRVESEEDRKHALEVFSLLPKAFLQSLSRVVIGSLRQKIFEIILEDGFYDTKYL